MSSHWKPIICVDFDGVIHSYERGWQGGEIYGHVVPGFFEWLASVLPHFQISIYSSRSRQVSGIIAMRDWVKSQHDAHVAAGGVAIDLSAVTFDYQKPKAFLSIDDRAIRFEGDWSDPSLSVSGMKAFKPWNSR